MLKMLCEPSTDSKLNFHSVFQVSVFFLTSTCSSGESAECVLESSFQPAIVVPKDHEAAVMEIMQTATTASCVLTTTAMNAVAADVIGMGNRPHLFLLHPPHRKNEVDGERVQRSSQPRPLPFFERRARLFRLCSPLPRPRTFDVCLLKKFAGAPLRRGHRCTFVLLRLLPRPASRVIIGGTSQDTDDIQVKENEEGFRSFLS